MIMDKKEMFCHGESIKEMTEYSNACLGTMIFSNSVCGRYNLPTFNV